MPRKKLQHPEDELLQNQEVTEGASQEAQPNAEIKKPKAEPRKPRVKKEKGEEEKGEKEKGERKKEKGEKEKGEEEKGEKEKGERRKKKEAPLSVEKPLSSEKPKTTTRKPRVKKEKGEEEKGEEEKGERRKKKEAPLSVEKPLSSESSELFEPSVNEMYAEIEETQNDSSVNKEEEEEDESETEKTTESIEDIEKEYEDYTLEQLVEKLQEIVAHPNFNEIKQRVSVLKASILHQTKLIKKEALEQFIEEGGNKEEFEYVPSEWEIKCEDALQIYKENKAKFLENLELEKQQNLEIKQQIIQGLKELVETESNLKILNDKFKEFQEKWRETGPVPQNESSNLWQHYHFYVEKFFDILRINKELRTLDLKKNLEQKVKLCEQAEELLLQESIGKSFKALQHLHEEWREVGPVPEDKKEEIWERFKNASDQLNKRRRAHYDSLLEEQQNSYNAKVVICEQAEELVSFDPKTLKENHAVGDKLTELLKVWKTLGPAPAKLNEDIWKRFKTSLDKFFISKKEYFQQLKNEQSQNYNQKLTLAIQAEALALRTDWKKATDDIIKLQNEWKQIGPTSRKNSEIVWKRFRKACDQYFANKANYFANAQDIESVNLQKKEELIKKIEEHQFSDNKEENLEVMKTYQREFMELGHVPRKDKDKIYTKFREAVNKRFQDLKMTMEDVKRSNFKSKIDTILNNPNANIILDKERRFLTNKLQQLKDDIALWENNLGFFANSKNADLLRAEFTKKIEAAKIEVKELEYKIKVMVHQK
ncbi:MAG: DUF349 domain-containing protein [Lentimicrobiaceae bacterium]|nr:DUF349 domain-containing protein [Lentimicrobiaceae bacterium]